MHRPRASLLATYKFRVHATLPLHPYMMHSILCPVATQTSHTHPRTECAPSCKLHSLVCNVMGLSSEIKKLLATRWAPDAFKPDTEPSNTPERYDGMHCVYIRDYLCYFRGLPSEDREGNPVTYTHTELFDHFFNLADKPSIATVMVIDDHMNIPVLKRHTQHKRAIAIQANDAKNERDAAVPYPPGTSFVPGGVAYIDPASGQAVIEGICLRRLRITRGAKDCDLGDDLWKSFRPLILQKMQQISETRPEADWRFLLFDHEASGTEYYTPRSTQIHKSVTTPLHDLGEADPAMIAHVYSIEANDTANDVKHIHLFTKDMDIIPLYLKYHTKRTHVQIARTTIWWHDGYGKIVDMALMAALAVQNVPNCTSASELADAIALTGTDFTFKETTCFGTNEKNIILAYMATSKMLPTALRYRAWLIKVWENFLIGEKKTNALIESIRASKLTAQEQFEDFDAIAATQQAAFGLIRSRHAAVYPKMKAEAEFRSREKLARMEADMSMSRSLKASDLADKEKKFNKAVAADRKRLAEMGSRFPSDDVIDDECEKWMIVNEYWDNAHTGKRPEEMQVLALQTPASDSTSAPAAAAAAASAAAAAPLISALHEWETL